MWSRLTRQVSWRPFLRLLILVPAVVGGYFVARQWSKDTITPTSFIETKQSEYVRHFAFSNNEEFIALNNGEDGFLELWNTNPTTL